MFSSLDTQRRLRLVDAWRRATEHRLAELQRELDLRHAHAGSRSEFAIRRDLEQLSADVDLVVEFIRGLSR